MMSRQHYRMIATILKHHQPCADHAILVEEFTAVLRIDNPRFDADKFRAACQPVRKP